LLPMMEKTVLFYEDFLIEYDENGHILFAPSYSPENKPSNSKVSASVNATMDIAAAKEVFTNLISIYDYLGIKPEKKKLLEAKLQKFPPYLINSDGALKEWAIAEKSASIFRLNSRYLPVTLDPLSKSRP
jgi:alpha-L-fucosidase 2